MNFVYWVATIMIALMTSATAQQSEPCPSVHKPVLRMTQEWDGSAWKRVREPCLDPTKDEIIEKEKERARQEQQQQKQQQQQQDSGTDQ